MKPESRQTDELAANENGYYPLKDLCSDFFIAAFGMALGVLAVVNVALGSVWQLFFFAFFAMALWYFVRTWRLFKTQVRLSKSKVWINGRSFELKTLKHVKLRFYGSLRQKARGDGTYVLHAKFHDRKGFWVEQRLTNFQDLIEVIGAHDPPGDHTTQRYFQIHGVTLSSHDS